MANQFARTRIPFFCRTALVVLFLCHTQAIFGQQSQNKNQSSQSHLKEARQSYQTAEKELNEAKMAEKKAIQEREKASGKMTSVRKELEDEIKTRSDWQQPHTALEEAKTKYENVSTPILTALHESSEFLTLAEEIKNLNKQLGSQEITAAERKDLVKTLAAARAKELELENQAIAASPPATAAKKDLDKAKETMIEVSRKLFAAIDEDPGYRRAKQDFDSAVAEIKTRTAEVKAATAKLAKASEAIQVAEKRIQQEQANSLRNRRRTNIK